MTNETQPKLGNLSLSLVSVVTLVVMLVVPTAAIAASCEKSQWRRGLTTDSDYNEPQTFRIRVRNRSSVKDLTMAKSKSTMEPIMIDRGFKNIYNKSFKSEDKGDYSVDFDIFSESRAPTGKTCTSEFSIRKRENMDSVKFVEIRFKEFACSSPPGLRIKCERDYGPDKRRMNLLLTIKDR